MPLAAWGYPEEQGDGVGHSETLCSYPKLYHIASVCYQIEHAVNMFAPHECVPQIFNEHLFFVMGS